MEMWHNWAIRLTVLLNGMFILSVAPQSTVRSSFKCCSNAVCIQSLSCPHGCLLDISRGNTSLTQYQIHHGCAKEHDVSTAQFHLDSYMCRMDLNEHYTCACRKDHCNMGTIADDRITRLRPTYTCCTKISCRLGQSQTGCVECSVTYKQQRFTNLRCENELRSSFIEQHVAIGADFVCRANRASVEVVCSCYKDRCNARHLDQIANYYKHYSRFQPINITKHFLTSDTSRINNLSLFLSFCCILLMY